MTGKTMKSSAAGPLTDAEADCAPVAGDPVESDPLLRRVRELQMRGMAKARADREAEEARLAQDGLPPENARADDDLVAAFRHSAPVEKRLAKIERRLVDAEADGFFAALPLRPGSEFPSLLARLPIFLPTRRQRQKTLQDEDNALPFTTPFGDGRRHGPPLTVRDEDTLIALMRLRSKRLYGKPAVLPARIAATYKEGQGGQVGVHCVVCSVDQINREMGLSDGGPNFKRTLASVKRLGAVRLELNLRAHDRYLGETTTGKMFDLINVEWEVHETHGVLVVLFPPVMARWLEKEYTYLDWSVRKQLGDLGKALHRFLSSQPRQYRSPVSRVCTTIGFDGPMKNVKQRFGTALDELQETGWLTGYEFAGSGRSSPLELVTWRDDKSEDTTKAGQIE